MELSVDSDRPEEVGPAPLLQGSFKPDVDESAHAPVALPVAEFRAGGDFQTSPPEIAALAHPKPAVSVHVETQGDSSSSSPVHLDRQPASPMEVLQSVAGSPILWWGGGNCLASFGVSWIGFVCNLVLTPISLWRGVSSSGEPTRAHAEKEQDVVGRASLKDWRHSPAWFALVDTFVVGIQAGEALVYAALASGPQAALLCKGIAFALYMVGSVGAVADINRDYWEGKGVAEPLGKQISALFRMLPGAGQRALLCTGLWWGAGDCIIGVSELSLTLLKSSPVTASLLACSGLLGGAAVVRAMVAGSQSAEETKKATYLIVAASHLLYAASNFSAGAWLMTGAFASWAMTSCLLAYSLKTGVQPEVGKSTTV